jgi:hypothetical protein
MTLFFLSGDVVADRMSAMEADAIEANPYLDMLPSLWSAFW